MGNQQKYHQLIPSKPFTPFGVAFDPEKTKAGAATQLAPILMIAANQLGVSFRIDEEIKNMADELKKRMPATGGVLLCVAIREWDQSDFNGERAQALLEIHIAGSGTDKQAVLKNYLNTPRMVQGAPSGWRRRESFRWYTGDTKNLQEITVLY